MRNPFAAHVPDRRLLDTVAGNPTALSARDHQHLDACAWCRRRLVRFESIETALRGPWSEVELTAPATRGALPQLASLAAVAAAVVVITVALGARMVGFTAPASPPPGTGGTAATVPSGSSPSPTGPVQIAGPFGALEWKPDGTELLIAGQEGFRRIDASGHVLEAIPQAEAASWVDDDHFAVWRGDVTSSSVGSVEIRSVTGSSVAVDGTYTSEVLGSGHGGIVLVPASGANPGGNGTFVVWSSGLLSRPIDGLPFGWSQDGAKIVVGRGSVQSLGADIQQVPAAIATYPGLEIRSLTGVSADPKYLPAFSADGRLVAFSCATLNPREMCGQVVVDLGSGRARMVGHQPIGLPLSWLPGDRLLLSSASYPDPGPLQVWDGTTVVPSGLAIGSSGIAASNGAVAASIENTATGGTVTIYSATGTVLSSLPGAAAVWSPNGSSVAIVPSDPAGELVIVPILGP